MTVQTYEPGALVPAVSAVVDLPAGLPAEMAAIVQWANTAEAARRLVLAIVDTPFFPQAFWPRFDSRDKEAAAAAREVAVASGTAAVLYGGPLRLNPLQSLANIHVVKGKPGLPAELMVALVRSAGHEVAVEDLTDHRCRMWGKRAGNEHVYRAEFDIARATKAGYVAQNTKYKTDPQAMLYARAASILCRQMAPEVLKGLAAAEELQDEPGEGGAPATTTRSVKRAAAVERPQLAAPAPAAQAPQSVPSVDLPPLPGEDDEPAPEAAPAASSGQIDEKTWKRINDQFVKLGVTGPGQTAKRLAVIGAVVGREVTRGGELTEEEGSDVLGHLSADLVRDVLSPPATEQAEPAETPEPMSHPDRPDWRPETAEEAAADPADPGDPWAPQP